MSVTPLTYAQITELPVGITVYRTLITTDGNLIAVDISECRIIDRDGVKRHVYVEGGRPGCGVSTANYSLADLGGVLKYANAFLTREDAKNYRTEVFDGKHSDVVNDMKAMYQKMDDTRRMLRQILGSNST
jgi:hypothetical protein